MSIYNANIYKLIIMLSAEIDKFTESEDLQLKLVNDLYLELQRFIKLKAKKLESARLDLALKLLDGQIEKQIEDLQIRYKGTNRFALDTKKLTTFFLDDLKYSEQEMKHKIYSHTQTSPTLKISTVS